MKELISIVVATALLSGAAHADVWKWVDANGTTHFVDTTKPIYTWLDETGKVHYSDTPDHEDAVSVELVWHAKGTLEDAAQSDGAAADLDSYYEGESAEDRAARLKAEAYYCERATQIHDSYVNAPRLYKTDENGERQYLTKEEAAREIAESRARRDEFCG